VNKIRLLLKPLTVGINSSQALYFAAIAALIVNGLFLIFSFQVAFYFSVFLGVFGLRYPWVVRAIASYPRLRTIVNAQSIGTLIGTFLFFSTTIHANPAFAQIFDQAEKQVTTIFGDYIDSTIVAFLFGLIRVVIWVSGIGFVFFAIYQAQRGEQWQPLAQNAFIIISAVVLVEALSNLFFGGGAGTGDGGDGGDSTGDGTG
jgi:hypothetical protein